MQASCFKHKELTKTQEQGSQHLIRQVRRKTKEAPHMLFLFLCSYRQQTKEELLKGGT